MKNGRSKSVGRFCLILGFISGFICCGEGKGTFANKTYPEGFSLDHPGDWSARVLDKGLILVSAEDVRKDPSFIAVYPFILKSAANSRTWLEQNLETLGDFLARPVLGKIRQLRPLPDETAVRIKFTREGVPCEGTALCSIDGKSGVLYVMAAREGEFDVRKPRLLASLRSFRFGVPENSTAAVPAKPKIPYVSWQDPVEQAFTLEVPAGWQVAGGTKRRAAVDIVHVLQAVSPDQRSQIIFNDGNIPAFVLPNQMLEWTGFREGSWYSPGYGVQNMVMRYQPGLTFLLGYLRQNFAPRLPSFQLAEQKERPDIVEQFNRIYSRSQVYGISTRLDAGDAAFRYDQAGAPGVGYGLAVTQIAQSMSNGVGNWNVSLLFLALGPEAEAETIREISTHMFQTIRMNPQWVAGQQQLTGNVSKIVTETGQAISGIINDTYWTRQGTLDDVNRKFSNATLGVTDVVDSATGDAYKVEAGHNYYWSRSGTNQVVGTGTYTRPDIDFTPLIEF
jgi:hypothetical protein